ncbi:hypothetical protein [Nocardioides aurantiacus]|uniref:Uncharacterized protein n=1 Tax=Nocardioides aurantiacus TaxID=86796 RepID=A0A3N2CSF7_9ACTN|nr:hypothetical protein [Nocardioides aurantiacus]ROR90459.1 hypothetical protein EDD33_1299 [Nocardioides aurantiacus]
MSDADEPPTGPGDGPGGPSGDPAGEPVGSVGEEAAKLFGALSDWARDQGADHLGGLGGVAGMGQGIGAAARSAEEHLATGGADCRWCPVCQLISVVRQTSPEVRSHLTAAAGSLVQAAAALLATPPHGQGQQVEKIDLDDESVWDEQEWDGER